MKIKEVHIRWIGIPIMGYVMTFFIKSEMHAGMPFLENYLISTLFTAILWNGCFLIIMGFRKVYPNIDQTAKRLLITSFWNAVLLIFGANIIGLCLGLCTFGTLMDPQFFFRHAQINLIAAFMVASVYESVFFFSKWQESVQRIEALKTQQIRTQFEVLQNQMSPHFLFNSLNTLTTLIAENQHTAIAFTQTLSEVYRYILQNKEKELVSMDEETAFCRSYVYLLQMRFPENLHVDCKITTDHNHLHIAPLTAQMLIENAIKHNIISKTKPLHITVEIENDDTLVVRNSLQIKSSLEKSTKTGLSNIQKRYSLLGNRTIEIVDQGDEFIVKVPLIKMINQHNNLHSILG